MDRGGICTELHLKLLDAGVSRLPCDWRERWVWEAFRVVADFDGHGEELLTTINMTLTLMCNSV